MFIRRDFYEYMNKPTMKWKERTKAADTRENVLTNLFIEMETERKKETEMLFLWICKKLPYFVMS